jgi:tetratricopeptide (TPR) repeat protein
MILATGAYAVYVRRGEIWRYIGVLILFAMGLMGKPMLVTLPFVLLLLDYWPLERARFGKDDLEGGGITAGVERRSLLYLVKEKIPFFVLSVISSVVTFVVQKSSGAVVPFEHFNLRIRLMNAAISYVSYIWKMIWPSRLAAFYPHQGDKTSIIAAFFCAIFLVIVTVGFVYFGVRRKYLAVGWLWYIVMLLPVIGLVQVGGQSMADRYMYMPMTGLLIIVTWGIWELTERLTQQKVILTVLSGGVLLASAMVTANQIKYWQNSKMLFKRVIDVSPDAWYMHSNYANFLKDEGQVDEAIKHYRIAVGIKPDFEGAYYNMGNAFRKIDKLDEAAACYEKAIELKPKFADAHCNLGMVFAQMQKRDKALAELNKVLELKPNDAEAISSIGLLYAEQGQFEKAVEYYRKAIAIDPEYIVAHGRLGLILGNQGKYAEALEQFRVVLKARPDDAEMWRNSAIMLEKLGKIDEAAEYYRKALAINPNDAEVKRLLDATTANKESK